MRRRLLSLCLVICMVLGMLPVMAMATEPVKITVKAGEAEYEASCVDAGSAYAVQIPEATAVTIGKTDAAAGDYTAANVSGGLLVSFQEYPLELTAEELSKCVLTDAQKANCGDVGIDLSVGNWACIILSDGEEQQNLFLLLGDAGVMAADAKEIPVNNNVIDITNKRVYEFRGIFYADVTDVKISGADVVSATEDGTTVNVLLAGTTPADAAVSVSFGTSLYYCTMSGNAGSITLIDGAGTLTMTLTGEYNSSNKGTAVYTINFTTEAPPTEVPARLAETDAREGYRGVAMEIGLEDYFKLASTYYLVEGETLTELEGKSYTFTPAEGGTHTLTFAAGNVVGVCPDYVTVTVEAMELKSGIWVLHETSNGSFNFIQFTDANGEPIEGLNATIEGSKITVALPQSYDLAGKVTATFNLTQNSSGLPFLSTKTGTSGTASGKAVNNKVSALTTTLSSGQGTATAYYYNANPTNNSNNYTTFTINYRIFNNIPEFAEGVTGTDEKTIQAVTDTYSVDLSKLFTDKDEQTLTYKVSINDSTYTACDANYSFSTDLAGTYVLKFRANDGQDYSADTYTVTLTVENSTTTYAVPVTVADSVEGLTFHADSLSGDVLTYADGSVQVPLNVKAIWWKTADGMTGTAPVSDGTSLNLQLTTFVVKTMLGDVDAGSKITVTDPDGNVVSGNGFVYLLDSGAGYSYKATSSISGWAANTLQDQTVTSDLTSTVEITLLVNAARTVTVDKGAEIKVYYQPKYYVLEEVKPVYSIDNGDTVTYVYSCSKAEANAMGYLYFAKKDGLIDKAGYLTMVTDTTVTWVGETRTSFYRGTYDRSTRFGKRGDDSVLVNVNSSGHLVLNQGSTYRLRALRIWEIIDHDSGNVIIEPEFTYTNFGADVITLSNVTDKIPGASGNNWVDMKATGSGVAFLEVGYEALHLVDGLGEGEIELSTAYGQPNNFTWNASDPTRTALVVVQTDGNAASDVTFGIRNNSGGTWDAEFDTLYFTGSYGQLTFTPSATSGITNVAVSNNKGESFTTLTADENGAYTATIVPGANVIRITNGSGKTAYQVVRGDQVTITVTNITEGKAGTAPIQPGDTVRVDFAGIHSPMGKTSGLFNSSSHQVLYYGNGKTEHLSEYAGYELPGGVSIELTIPQDAQSYTLTGGCISFSGWGKFNMHRSLTDNGLPQNTGADKLTGKRVSLPDIELLADNTTYTVTLTEGEGYTISACEGSENPVKQGGSFSFTVTVDAENYEGTPVVKAGETVLTAVDGVYTIEAITADVTITVEGITATEFGLTQSEIAGYVTIGFEDNGVRVAGETGLKYPVPLGTIIPQTRVPFKSGENMAQVTLRLLDHKGIGYSSSGNVTSNFYLASIKNFEVNNILYDSMGEFDAGSESGWHVTLNDWFIDKSTFEFTVSDGDVIQWQYTCQNGKDIGNLPTYTVTLTDGEGYTIAACEGSENPVKQGGSFSFTVTVDAENYEGTPVVKAGETVLTAVDGVYTIEAIMADVTITVEGVEKKEETVTYPLTIVAPIGSTVSVGTMRSNFNYTFAESLAVTQDYDAGTVTYGFNIPETSGNKFLRVQNPEGVTYWDYNPQLGIEGAVITITEDMLFMNDSSFNADTIYRNFEHGNDLDVADVLLNVNEKGYINLSTGGTYELNVIRDWMAVESMMNSKTALPDVSYQVIDFYGNQSNVLSVTPDANNSSVAIITANAPGTAVVLVTYDAMYSTEALQNSQSAFGAPERFSAIWPENTGVLVVSVGQDGTSLTTNMTLNANNTSSKLAGTAIDAEHDVLYYVGSEGASYTFTPPAGSTVSIARASLTSRSLTYNGFVAVPANADGSFTLTGLTTGSHIVKVEQGGVATYQVIGAKQTSYTIVDAEGNPINEEHKAQPGETLTITLGDVYSGLNKVSTFYNPNCAVRYVGQDGTKASYKAGDNYDQYNFAACSHVLTITLPDQWVNETYCLTGYLTNTGYGSPAGSHRALRYATGSSTNENATICIVNLGQLAPIDIPVEVSQRVPATGITLSSESLTLVLGGVTKMSAAIEPADTTDVVAWTSSDESVVKVTGDGFLTAVSQGSATITATVGDVSAACVVTVPEGGGNLVITTPTQTNERFITSITLHGVGAATAEKTGTRDYNISLPAGSYDTLTITLTASCTGNYAPGTTKNNYFWANGIADTAALAQSYPDMTYTVTVTPQWTEEGTAQVTVGLGTADAIGGSKLRHILYLTKPKEEAVTYTVSLPENPTGYTIAACEGSENPVKQGGSFSFTVTVDAENYEGTPVVKAGETVLTAVNGVYTIENINADQTVTVSGIEKIVPTYGNMDGDGDVDVFDAALVYSIVNGRTEATPEQLACADVNGDGVVNVFDAALVYSYANGKLNSFPGQN